MRKYNESRIWNDCRGVVLDYDIFRNPDLSDGNKRDLLWPLIATSIVSYHDYADEAAIVRFWIDFTENYDGDLKVYLQDDIHGVLFGIPRWVQNGKITPAVKEDDLDTIYSRYPDPLRNELLDVTKRQYHEAVQGKWNDIREAKTTIRLVTDSRLVYHVEGRFGPLGQAVVNLTRSFIGLLRVSDSIEMENPYELRDCEVKLDVPRSFVEMVDSTALEAGISTNDLINYALTYALTVAW